MNLKSLKQLQKEIEQLRAELSSLRMKVDYHINSSHHTPQPTWGFTSESQHDQPNYYKGQKP